MYRLGNLLEWQTVEQTEKINMLPIQLMNDD